MSQVQASETAAGATAKRLPILLVYKSLAYVTGVGLIILVFVGIPLQIWAHNKDVVAVVGTLHGFLYIGYVIVALTLSLQARFNPIKTVLVAAAGTVPFCAFVAEHYIARDAEAAILRNRAKAKARRERRMAAAAGSRPRPARPASRPSEQRVPRQATPRSAATQSTTDGAATEAVPSAE